MVAEIDRLHDDGDTLGGVVEVLAYGGPVGLGSHVHWDRRLDAQLAAAVADGVPGGLEPLADVVERRHAEDDPLQHTALPWAVGLEQGHLPLPRVSADEGEGVRPLDLVQPAALREQAGNGVAVGRPERDVVEGRDVHPTCLPGSVRSRTSGRKARWPTGTPSRSTVCASSAAGARRWPASRSTSGAGRSPGSSARAGAASRRSCARSSGRRSSPPGPCWSSASPPGRHRCGPRSRTRRRLRPSTAT